MKLFKCTFAATLLLLILPAFANAQQTSDNSKYWVFLKNKNGVTFDPYSYFDAKTIERRIKFNIPLVDSTDFPLNREYYSTVAGMVDSTGNSTRWFNAITVYATPEQVEKLKELNFVQSVEPMQLTCILASVPTEWDTAVHGDKQKILSEQISVMGGELFEEKGIDGKGMRIAIFDGGFPTVNTSPAFEHIRKDGRILKTWDFTKNKEFVYSYNTHGCEVMSCIAGMINGKKIGMATGAEFLLARTEVNSEPFSEEENWLAAAEWADKNGADIINSSLGYTYHRYFPYQMDGRSTLVTRAANMAARKGMLVVNAAGNDGKNDWKCIGAPADADSVLSVGGINPWSGYHTAFSSYGPTWDRRMKPNVCAYGHVTAAGKNGMVSTQGTSFASPLMAGFTACAWQNNRNLNNMQMFAELEKSGDLYPYFDYAHGYGIPQASYFLSKTNDSIMPTFEFEMKDSVLRVIVKPEFIDKTDPSRNKYLYYNFQKEDGVLSQYNIVIVNSEEPPVEIYTAYLPKGLRINVHYKNYTATFQL